MALPRSFAASPNHAESRGCHPPGVSTVVNRGSAAGSLRNLLDARWLGPSGRSRVTMLALLAIDVVISLVEAKAGPRVWIALCWPRRTSSGKDGSRSVRSRASRTRISRTSPRHAPESDRVPRQRRTGIHPRDYQARQAGAAAGTRGMRSRPGRSPRRQPWRSWRWGCRASLTARRSTQRKPATSHRGGSLATVWRVLR